MGRAKRILSYLLFVAFLLLAAGGVSGIPETWKLFC